VVVFPTFDASRIVMTIIFRVSISLIIVALSRATFVMCGFSIETFVLRSEEMPEYRCCCLEVEPLQRIKEGGFYLCFWRCKRI